MTDDKSKIEQNAKPSDPTIPSRALAKQPKDTEAQKPNAAELLKNTKEFISKAIQVLEEDESKELIEAAEANLPQPPAEPPWTLQQFFNGEIDLDVELASRFSAMPVMSTVKFRTLGTRTGRGVATISTSDGAATVIFDADKASQVVQVSFTFGSMLTLRFVLRDLVDRTRWLELMRRHEGGLAFLWGPTRWEQDYVICIARKYYSNFYAFSPNGFEAAARFTPDVTKKLLDWLESYWVEEKDDGDDDPPMLTW